MGELLEKVERYWESRSEADCLNMIHELNSFKKSAWQELISERINNTASGKLKILDVGTGTGFLAVIMALQGHDVTAIDYTEAMIQRAINIAEFFKCKIHFQRMDVHNLDFSDGFFDLVIMRNVTWNLVQPQTFYSECYRVLASGGKLLNFDANWYLHLSDRKKRAGYIRDRKNVAKNNMRDYYEGKSKKIIEEIARELPLSKQIRPEWDVKTLLDIGCSKITIDTSIGARVWDEEEEINFFSTPMFMVCAEK